MSGDGLHLFSAFTKPVSRKLNFSLMSTPDLGIEIYFLDVSPIFPSLLRSSAVLVVCSPLLSFATFGAPCVDSSVPINIFGMNASLLASWSMRRR